MKEHHVLEAKQLEKLCGINIVQYKQYFSCITVLFYSSDSDLGLKILP